MDKIFTTLGSSNHTVKERDTNDYYATEPKAAELLIELETVNNIWECACGEGHLSKVFNSYGYNVRSSDLIDRGYGDVLDFLKCDEKWLGDIITNPPYKYAIEFIEKGLELVEDGSKVIMFLKVLFLESQKRKKLFKKYPPKYIYVSSSRIQIAKGGDFKRMKEGGGSAIAYAWFVWVKGFKGDTIIRWFN